MNRTTKLLVLTSNLVALWLMARLVSRGIPPIFVPTASIFAVSLISSIVLGDITTTVILSLIYLVPTLCIAWFGNFQFSYYAIWLAALSGSMIPRAAKSGWAFPRRWAAPLVLWALTIAIIWPIVVLREVDFVPALLGRGDLWLGRSTVSPPVATTWILNVVSIAMTGLLLLDWMLLSFPAEAGARFERRIIWPVFSGAALAAAIGAYQSLVDLNFLNRSMWPSLGRTVGTMADANAFGTIMAMWLPFAGALAMGHEWRRRVVPASLVLFLIFGVALWGSGSRSAMMTALVGFLVFAGHIARSLTVRQVMGALVCLTLATVAIVTVLPPSTTGPWKRSMEQISSIPLSMHGLAEIARHAWRRDLYGPASEQMIVEHPLVGIGIGGFNYQFADALYVIDPLVQRPPDNAQNWYRQQLAEVGVLGSIGWIVWISQFLWMLLRRSGGQDTRAVVGAVKGALVGFGVGSLFGVPAQDAAASLTFIILVCWCLKLTTIDSGRAPIGDTRPGRLEWMAIIAVLGGFLGGTVYAARTDLRPPRRAVRFHFPFSYGFTADRTDPSIRWTGAKAVEVFEADKRWFKLEFGEVAPDAAEKPVDVKVWLNRLQILRVSRRGNFPVTRWIRMPAHGTPLMMEIHVDRTWRPSADEEARGIAVRAWAFADEDPPKGSITIESPDVFTR
ncbi:MAG: O-antigen ligase family protein [Vicinamibacterales bacterium]|nr:O-antigen ligase family protein [Vicinamibacterales bacterium]